mgnify:FL=1
MIHLLVILVLAGPAPQQQQAPPSPLTPPVIVLREQPPEGGGFPWAVAVPSACGVLAAGITAWGGVYAVRRKRRK